MNNKLILATLLAVTLIASLLLNVAIHELGHWSVAEHYELNPKISIEPSNLTSAKFLINGEPVIYTSYLGGQSTDKQDAIVALAGPLVNFMLFLGAMTLYFVIPKRKRNLYTDLFFVAIAMPALVSAIGNLIPIIGSDGWMIYNKLL